MGILNLHQLVQVDAAVCGTNTSHSFSEGSVERRQVRIRQDGSVGESGCPKTDNQVQFPELTW
jgi:hypothetical protein